MWSAIRFYTWTATFYLCYEQHWECIIFLYIILYVDDTNVLLNGKRYTDLVALLNSELEKLSLWLRSNILSFNVYTVFHRTKIKLIEHAVIIIDIVILRRTNSLKKIGVIIDYILNWTLHIYNARNRISKVIDNMYCARKYLSKLSIKKLYHLYIYIYIYISLSHLLH